MFLRKRLEHVQVEVSTYCQSRCIMCPRSIMDDWINMHMDIELFKKIPFEKFKYAHLQGWGEPLLNPNIIEMIEFAKKSGCSVGLTTNGILLQEFANELPKLVDLIAISVASPNPDIHKKVRKCDLHAIIEGIKMISQKNKCKVVITTLMLKDTVKDLPDLVKLAKYCGADEVIANNLDYIPTKDLLKLKVFSENNSEIIKCIEKAKNVANELGIKLVVKYLNLQECTICAENPIDGCLITVNGDISPCVYLHLPTKSKTIQRVFNHNIVQVPKLYFGNINEKEFDEIWKSKDYREFRRIFEKRVNAYFFDFPELPDVCKSCYKAYSI